MIKARGVLAKRGSTKPRDLHYTVNTLKAYVRENVHRMRWKARRNIALRYLIRRKKLNRSNGINIKEKKSAQCSIVNAL